jgi:hypothetical protein
MSDAYYEPGDHNVICDRTGHKIKRSQARKEWNGLLVRKESWEPRHPQDKIRGRPDRQSVPDPRPWSTQRFLSPTEVTASDLTGSGTPDSTDVGQAIWDGGHSVWDIGASLWD